MKQAVRIILTIGVAMVSCFVMLISVGYYFVARDSRAYDINAMVLPEIRDVQIRSLGGQYQGKSSQGNSYYELSILLENPGNSLKEGYELYFSYEDENGDSYGHVIEVRDGLEGLNSGINALPAGMTGVITKVVQVDDNCKRFTLVESNYRAKDRKSFLVKL